MTPDEWLLDETHGWVRRAARGVAGRSALPLPTGCGKLLKAFLTWNQRAFRKTHELRELAIVCTEIDETLGPALEPAIFR